MPPKKDTDVWMTWINAGDKAKRKLIVQTMNALYLSYKWESLENAVKNLNFLHRTPADSSYAINEAYHHCKAFEWSAQQIRADFR